MDRNELMQRTEKIGHRLIKLYLRLRKIDNGAEHAGLQLLRCGTSIGANYAEATHGRSGADFVAKMKICEGEAAESVYWLRLISNSPWLQAGLLTDLLQEANELTAIFCAATATAKKSKT